MLRVSNLGPPSRNKFDKEINLVRGDLLKKQGRWTLIIHWAKNLQHRHQQMLCPLIPSADPRICPERWVQRMVKLILVKQEEPFFLVHEGSHRYPLAVSQINRLMKEWCKKVELDPKCYTAYCLH